MEQVARDVGVRMAVLEDSLDAAWREAEEAVINMPRSDPRWRHFSCGRLRVVGPWDIETNGHRPTYQAIAEPYNADGSGLNRNVEAIGPTPAAALRSLTAKLREEKP